MDKKQSIHVFFSGHVQGVGFRFTTERLAEKFGLAGFVRNLSDGRVELVCEGEKTVLNNFLAELEGTMREYITDYSTKWGKANNLFSSFHIRF